jgi:hypothetical protein
MDILLIWFEITIVVFIDFLLICQRMKTQQIKRTVKRRLSGLPLASVTSMKNH